MCSASACFAWFLYVPLSLPQEPALFHVMTLMTRLRLTGEKQQVRSHHRCVSISASRLESEHLPQLGFTAVQSRGSQLYKVRVHSCTKSGCSSTCTSHLPQSQFLTLKPFSSHCQMPHPLHGWLCPVRLCQIVAPSLRVLLRPKINSKALVISVVAGLGLTSLAFIRNTSLGLCWYKST